MKLFGTDGIRGRANEFPITPEVALRAGKAVAQVLRSSGHNRNRVVIGKDTRISGYMLETAMLKVWSTDALWQIVNDMMQIYGGQGYFSNEPYERMMRDHRIDLILWRKIPAVLGISLLLYGLVTDTR